MAVEVSLSGWAHVELHVLCAAEFSCQLTMVPSEREDMAGNCARVCVEAVVGHD